MSDDEGEHVEEMRQGAPLGHFEGQDLPPIQIDQRSERSEINERQARSYSQPINRRFRAF